MDREFGQPNPYSTGTNLCFIDVTKVASGKKVLVCTFTEETQPKPSSKQRGSLRYCYST